MVNKKFKDSLTRTFFYSGSVWYFVSNILMMNSTDFFFLFFFKFIFKCDTQKDILYPKILMR